jgi:MscS family membrane protein
MLQGLALVLLFLTSGVARAEGSWEGFWESFSFGDDAYIKLSQDGNKVTGAYFPYNGRLEGIAEGADGRVLRGTWTSPNGTGTFVFTLSPDGLLFSGYVGTGEYWNGRRIEEESVKSLEIELGSPSLSIRSFMEAGHAYRDGEISGLQSMFSTLRFGEDPGYAAKSLRARTLHDVLSLTTFRVFEVRPAQGLPAEGGPDRFEYRFRQAGSEEELELAFEKDRFGLWRIVAPELETLQETLRAMLQARGLRELDPRQYRQLSSPRHAIQAFISGMESWDRGGQELVRRTLDLSSISERLRDWRLPILASLLASNLNRISHLTLEEIPDDPDFCRTGARSRSGNGWGSASWPSFFPCCCTCWHAAMSVIDAWEKRRSAPGCRAAGRCSSASSASARSGSWRPSLWGCRTDCPASSTESACCCSSQVSRGCSTS